MAEFSRRGFLEAGPLAAMALAAGGQLAGGVASDSRAGSRLEEFGYGDVSITSELHESQLTNTHAVLMDLSEDSLLKPLRQMSKCRRQARIWAGGIATIPITITARTSIWDLLPLAYLGNGSRRWRALMRSPEMRRRVKK